MGSTASAEVKQQRRFFHNYDQYLSQYGKNQPTNILDNNFSSDTIFGFGNNAKGQLGLGDAFVQSKLRGVHSAQFQFVASADQEVNLVATGGYFTILTTGSRNQQVFVCGENSYGQLFMNPETVKKLTTFTELDPEDHPWLNRGIRAIGCGRNFTIVITRDNRIVSVGSNYEGQLGRDPQAIRSAFQCSEPIGDGSLDFVKVACGSEHSLLLTSDGRVLCAGAERHGAIAPLDHEVPGYGDEWKFFSGFANRSKDTTVTDIACGLYFSAFLVNNRQVYVCGYNRSSGQKYTQPTLVFDASTVGSQGIKSIACAGRSLVVLTAEAELYMQGEALAFRHDYETMTHVPYASLGIPPIDIRLIAGGEEHMIFVTSNNHMYVCGSDSFGQLGEDIKQTSNQLSIGPLRNFNSELEQEERSAPCVLWCLL